MNLPSRRNHRKSLFNQVDLRVEELPSIIAPATLAALALLSPANGATGVMNLPTMMWQSVTNANSYRLVFSASLSSLPTGTTNPPTGPNNILVGNATSYTLTAPLPAGDTVYWTARAGNATAGSLWAPARSFKVASPDTSAPTFSNPLLAGKAPGASFQANVGDVFTMSGSVSDNVGVVKLTFNLSGPKANDFTIKSISVSGINQSLTGFSINTADLSYAGVSGTYYVTLFAKDAAGNVAQQSWTFTLKSPDTTAPTFSNLLLAGQAPNTTIQAKLGDVLNVVGSAFDNVSVKTLTLNLSGPKGNDLLVNSISPNAASQGLTGFSINTADATYAGVPGTYYATLFAKDSSGNVTSKSWTFVIPSPTPVTPPPATGGKAYGGTAPNGSLYVVYSNQVKVDGTRAWRNNNPGNMRLTDFSFANGAIGEAGDFAIFSDEATGSKALMALLHTNTYQALTIYGAIARYAPPSDNNNTDTYVAQVTQQTGLGAGTLLSSMNEAQLQSLADAIRKVEGWTVGQIYAKGDASAPAWVQTLLASTTTPVPMPTPTPVGAVVFPTTTVLTKDSTSPYATNLNAFTAGGNQGQCTWFTYARVIELAQTGSLDPSVKSMMENAFWGKTNRDAKNWPDFLGGNWTSTTKEPLPMSLRVPGMIAVWVAGDHGHVGFVEQISADKTQYRLTDFNRGLDEKYRDKWYDFVGTSDLLLGTYPQFLQLPLAKPAGGTPPTPGNTGTTPTIPDGFWASFNAGDLNTAGLGAAGNSSVQLLNAVGSLTSPDGSRFLALDTKGIADTSNFGGTQGSVLTSTSFTAGAFALSLRYNFLTNENANDATYNDFAQIRLVSASGAVLTTAKTIDTFANLASSTNTGYVRETSWQTLSFDLSPWKGQQVKLQFVVSDKGDTAIDSVLLLDDIVSVAASTALIANGNFEAGNLSGWTVTQGGQFPKIVSSGAAGSAFALQMGDGGTGLGGGNTASIQQAISVPASGAPVLSFNYKVEGNDGINWDWMKLYLDGKEIAVWATDTGGWQTFTYDLSAYKGKLVTLKFSSWTTDTFNQVNYFLDNVKITT